MLSEPPNPIPSREQLKDHIVELHKATGLRITRDYYRMNSHYPERFWQQYWPTFTAFVDEAIGVSMEIPSEPSRIDEIVGDRWNLEIPYTEVCTLDKLVEIYGVDLDKWTVERFKCSRWERPKGDSVLPLYSIKAEFKAREEAFDYKAALEEFKEAARQHSPHPYPVVPFLAEPGYCLELVIPDLHLNKLADGNETGHGDYDVGGAIDAYTTSIYQILKNAQQFPLEEIVLVVGNDLLHTDNAKGTTFKGTPLDSDVRYHKAYVLVRKMLVRVIELLRTFAPVKVLTIPGNHDTMSTFTLGDSLECWFDKYTDVTVDNSPTPYKFYQWGDVMLMLMHGDKGKKSDYAMWMATERPMMFGSTKFREVHIGHTHGRFVEEKFGITVRTFAALCKPDAWHSENGYVGNLRSAEGIIWHKTKGRVAEFIHTELD